ncbi:uncharacterized protein LOC120426179 [Culex pipiens pallens]|uniref:uncharacterized protein LOC120426179 n=1 Tax=Culex pipiens pallens TaxID=42434 RepID=UPI001953AEB7|nr:uncharacterized protein LOC120426179 [Culex pipiens pallens]
MNVIQFKLPGNFKPKSKAYRGRKKGRVWATPETLFTLCEIVLRKLLLPVASRRKFWSTVISFLPNETARFAVWHQVFCPEDFNQHLRSTVNYANHWALLSSERPPTGTNIRVGSLVRNKITQLLLDLDYCSSSDSECLLPPVGGQMAHFGTASREPYKTGEILPTELSPQASTCSCYRCYRCITDQYGYRRSLMARQRVAAPQLMVLGRGQMMNPRSSCPVQINDVISCGRCRAKL